MTAGIATLETITGNPDFYPGLESKTASLVAGLTESAAKAGVPVQLAQMGSMFGMFFSGEPVYDYESAKKSDLKAFRTFFHAMLERGIYLAPSQFEAGFMSAAHTKEDIARTLKAARESFRLVAAEK